MAELERDEAAGPALRRIGEILTAPSPYGLIKEAEGLISTVETVNDGLLAERRSRATAKIDEQIATVTQEIQTAEGDDALKAACLRPLEDLRGGIERQESLAHLSQAEVEAVRLKDQALEKIEASIEKAPPAPGGGPEKPKVKHRRVIKPAELATSGYLETKPEVDSFLDALRREMEDAIDNDERIEIR